MICGILGADLLLHTHFEVQKLLGTTTADLPTSAAPMFWDDLLGIVVDSCS